MVQSLAEQRVTRSRDHELSGWPTRETWGNREGNHKEGREEGDKEGIIHLRLLSKKLLTLRLPSVESFLERQARHGEPR
jgi:hypothetical protein